MVQNNAVQCRLITLIMAPVMNRDMRPSGFYLFLSSFTCFSAVLFVIKLITNSQLYPFPKLLVQFENFAQICFECFFGM